MLSQAQYTAAAVKRSGSVRVETHDKELSEAVDRVYEKYGNDLSAFYRDVKKSVNVEKCEDTPKRRRTSD